MTRYHLTALSDPDFPVGILDTHSEEIVGRYFAGHRASAERHCKLLNATARRTRERRRLGLIRQAALRRRRVTA